MDKHCHKCGYTRQDIDDGPDDVCPRCEAVYPKIESAPEIPSESTNSANKLQASEEKAVDMIVIALKKKDRATKKKMLQVIAAQYPKRDVTRFVEEYFSLNKPKRLLLLVKALKRHRVSPINDPYTKELFQNVRTKYPDSFEARVASQRIEQIEQLAQIKRETDCAEKEHRAIAAVESEPRLAYRLIREIEELCSDFSGPDVVPQLHQKLLQHWRNSRAEIKNVIATTKQDSSRIEAREAIKASELFVSKWKNTPHEGEALELNAPLKQRFGKCIEYLTIAKASEKSDPAKAWKFYYAITKRWPDSIEAKTASEAIATLPVEIRESQEIKEGLVEEDEAETVLLLEGKLFLLKNIVNPGGEGSGGYGLLFLYANNLTFVITMMNKANQLFSIPLQHITSALAGSEAGLNGYLEVRATLPDGKSRLLKFSEGISGIAMFSLISQTSPVFTQWADAINSARAELRTRMVNRRAETETEQVSAPQEPMAILKKRYAMGEITQDEYLRIKKDLME